MDCALIETNVRSKLRCWELETSWLVGTWAVCLNPSNYRNKYLLTESEVRTGKYLPEVFEQTERRYEVSVKQPKASTFLHGLSQRS